MSLDLPRDLADCRATLEELARRLSRAADAERERIARGLHDDLGQTLAAIKLRVQELLQAQTDTRRAAAGAAIEELTAQAIASARALTFDLMSPPLPEVGIAAGLRELFERVTSGHGIAGAFEAADARVSLAPETARTVYRVVRELLHNVIKHAGAEKVVVRLANEGAELTVTVADDGAGLPQPATGGGFGLLIARSRLAEVGGRLVVAPAPGGGTRAAVTVPLTDRQGGP